MLPFIKDWWLEMTEIHMHNNLHEFGMGYKGKEKKFQNTFIFRLPKNLTVSSVNTGEFTGETINLVETPEKVKDKMPRMPKRPSQSQRKKVKIISEVPSSRQEVEMNSQINFELAPDTDKTKPLRRIGKRTKYFLSSSDDDVEITDNDEKLSSKRRKKGAADKILHGPDPKLPDSSNKEKHDSSEDDPDGNGEPQN